MKLFVVTLSFIGIIGGIIIADIILCFIYQPKITDRGVQIVLFGKTPIGFFSFTNIIEIKRVSFQETLQLKNIFITLRLGLYGQGKVSS
jgi:hypothetical protein